MSSIRYVVVFVIFIVGGGLALIFFQSPIESSRTIASNSCNNIKEDQIWIEGGTFSMGAINFYRDEGPIHNVTIDGFWIDSHEVTNAQFAKFIEETNYVTVAERVPEKFPGMPPEMLKPGSVIFTPPDSVGNIVNWWNYVPGANWKHPNGPGSSIEGMDHYPVVHIAFEDAEAYAKWAGRSLPTEAQYEFAARSKREKQTYAWGGNELVVDGKYLANTWQGTFPVHNSNKDGYNGIAPIACFEPNDYGAYDLIGNVWEWTANWYAPKHDPQQNSNPQGPAEKDSSDKHNAGFPVKVIKGGSFLCAPNYCARYRPAARHAQDTALGAGHIGFRTVLNSETS